MNRIPRLAITAGEPSGIGPDLCVQLATRDYPAELVVVADPQMLGERAAQLGAVVVWNTFDPARPAQAHRQGQLTILAISADAPVHAGQLNPANARYVLNCLDAAVDGCRSGVFDALVTGRVKANLIDAKDLNSNAFKVVTERGVNYLLGRVTAREADRATDIARRTNGVQKVVRLFELISEEELLEMLTPPSTTPPQKQSAAQAY